MNKIIFLPIFCLSISFANGQQWSGTSTSNIYNLNTGYNVGIGTTTPTYPLTVVTTGQVPALFNSTTSTNTRIGIANTVGQVNLGVGSANPNSYVWSSTGNFYIGSDGTNPTVFVSGMAGGSVGIGTTTPSNSRTVVSPNTNLALFSSTGSANSAISVSTTSGQVNLGVGGANPNPYIWSNTGNFYIGSDGSNPTFYVNGMVGGSIGIGTTNTYGYTLAVNGSAIFTQAVVKQRANWPDYVFRAGYHLRPLREIEQYIQQQHHLPEVPSAAEVEKEGLDVGQNQVVLLKKIEELTLYIIDIKKESGKERRQMMKMIECQHKELQKLRAQFESQSNRKPIY